MEEFPTWFLGTLTAVGGALAVIGRVLWTAYRTREDENAAKLTSIEAQREIERIALIEKVDNTDKFVRNELLRQSEKQNTALEKCTTALDSNSRALNACVDFMKENRGNQSAEGQV